MSNVKETELFSGEWVLLYEDQIIDHSVNIEEILLLAEEQFPRDKFPTDKVRIKKIFQGSPREKLINK